MLKKQLSVFFLLILQGALAQDPDRRTLTTGPFQGIKVYSKIELNLIPSESNKAIVTGENKDAVILSMKNQELRIKLESENILNPGKTKIDLYFSRTLKRIEARQGARISSLQTFRQTEATLIAKTNSQIELSFETDHLDLYSSFGGRIVLKGATNTLFLKGTTGASCELEELVLPQAKINLIAGGYAYVAPEKKIEALVLGASVLRVYSNPEKKTTQKSLGGKIYFEKK